MRTDREKNCELQLYVDNFSFKEKYVQGSRFCKRFGECLPQSAIAITDTPSCLHARVQQAVARGPVPQGVQSRETSGLLEDKKMYFSDDSRNLDLQADHKMGCIP